MILIRVLVIIHYEDMSLGQPTAIIRIPDGMTMEDCYHKWLEQNGHPKDWEAQPGEYELEELDEDEEEEDSSEK